MPTALLTDLAKLADIIITNKNAGFDYAMDVKTWEHKAQELAQVDLKLINSDDEKKTFWINLYNIYIKYLIGKYRLSGVVTDKFWIFFWPHLKVGKYRFSLDDMEHGILRSNKGAAFGIFGHFLPWDFRRKLICEWSDYRIHFALNQGAKSSPPIKFYHSAEIDLELDKAEYSFAKQNFMIDHEQRIIHASPLFNWYKEDFRRSYLGNREYRHYRVKYLPFDWNVI